MECCAKHSTSAEKIKSNQIKDKLYRMRHIWIIFGKGPHTCVKMARQAHFSTKKFSFKKVCTFNRNHNRVGIFGGPMAPVQRNDPDMKHSFLKQVYPS